MRKYHSSDRVDRRKEGQHFEIVVYCFLVGNDILVSDEQSNGSHEQGLLHVGGRA